MSKNKSTPTSNSAQLSLFDYQPTPMKRCGKCGETKYATNEFFPRDKTCRYGVSSMCKTCWAKHDAQKYRDNKTAIRENDRAWTKNNPDKKREIVNRRKERVQSAPHYDIPFSKKDQIESQHGLCFYCGSPLIKGKTQVDHKIPISRGGDNHPNNKVMCCQTCNARKFTKTAEEFMRILETEKGG